jgi:hypothetical protein
MRCRFIAVHNARFGGAVNCNQVVIKIDHPWVCYAAEMALSEPWANQDVAETRFPLLFLDFSDIRS